MNGSSKVLRSRSGDYENCRLILFRTCYFLVLVIAFVLVRSLNRNYTFASSVLPKRSADGALALTLHKDMIRGWRIEQHIPVDDPEDVVINLEQHQGLVDCLGALLHLPGKICNQVVRCIKEESHEKITVEQFRTCVSFLQNSDVMTHRLWLECSHSVPPALPPRTLIVRVAKFVGARIHSTARINGWSDGDWIDECNRMIQYFSVELQADVAPNWFARVAACVPDIELPTRSSDARGPLAGAKFKDHFRKMCSLRFLSGARAWKAGDHVAHLANVHLSSGTVDIDQMCMNLQLMIRHKQRHVMSPMLARVLLVISFLRVHTSKAMRDFMPSICKNNTKIHTLVMQMQSMFGNMSRNETAMHKWWRFLDVRPPVQRLQKNTQKTKQDRVVNNNKRIKVLNQTQSVDHDTHGNESPVEDWEVDYNTEKLVQGPDIATQTQCILVRNDRSGVIHIRNGDGTGNCVWNSLAQGSLVSYPLSAPLVLRCPVCFAKPAGLFFGGADRQSFRVASSVDEVPVDPTVTSLGALRAKIDQAFATADESLRNELKPDWSNFMDFAVLRNILIDPSDLQPIDSANKLEADCKVHLEELMSAGRQMSYAECVAQAQKVPTKACFHTVEHDVFEFLANVYGTDIHVASAPDESNVSFFAGEKILKVYDGKGLFSKFLIHVHIVIISGASKSPLLVFYVNDVLTRVVDDLQRTPDAQFLQDVLSDTLKKHENWLSTTEINFGGILRKAKASKGLVRIIADEIDTIVNENGKREPSKLLSSHFIHVCDCSMPDLGKELTNEDASGTRLQEAPKVVVSVGDQPDEMQKYTPYTRKGESYRLDPICGCTEHILQQKRNNKKADRMQAALFLNRRYAAIHDQTKHATDITLTEESMGITNIVESCTKQILTERHAQDPMFSYLVGKSDSKLMNQGALVSLRRGAVLRCIHPLANLDRQAVLEDMLMAYYRMKVRNWYVRAAINHIHFQKGSQLQRDSGSPEEMVLARAMSLLLSNTDDNGKLKKNDAWQRLRTKSEERKFASEKGIVTLLNALNKAGLVLRVASNVVEEPNEPTMVDASPDVEIKTLAHNRKHYAPVAVLKRKWDDHVDRNVRARLERTGLVLEEPDL